jgi:spore maturation protein CgeB
MYNSRIIVTGNPSDWEGDFRLWESMASGALVFMDTMQTPAPFPLRHGETIVFYSTYNESDFLAKLHYYLTHEEEARKIARNGYLHALRHHRTVNFIDYILKTIHVRELRDFDHSVGGLSGCYNYSYCGQQLVEELQRTRE